MIIKNFKRKTCNTMFHLLDWEDFIRVKQQCTTYLKAKKTVKINNKNK